LWETSGFLTLQNWIDNIILQKESGDPKAMIVPGVTSVKVAKHTNDQLAEILLGNFATYTVLPLILIYLRMTYGLLQEKEKKIREGMKIMGMKDSSFYLSWIIHYFIVYLITSIVITF
jgi:ATP-binding cassette subfamily A (ABC1) protein 3